MSEASDNEPVRPRAPGLFAVLVARGVVTPEQLAPLLARLPEEQYVRTSARGGEGFDSRRWPLAHDAALARFIAGRQDDPALARALLGLAGAGAEAAARLAERAIAAGRLEARELVAAALGLIGAGPQRSSGS